METRNQSVFGHVKDDLSDIKTMLKMITAKLEKQSPALESTLANNGFFTSSGQASHLMGVTIQISGSSVHGGSAHSLGGIQLLSPANPLGHEPVHGNTHFHYPMVSNTFSNAPSPEFNHLQQLSTHNGNYSNSIPSIEYNMLKFDGGEDVRSWISECERVFILENTPQNCKVHRATMALEGSAFIWHRVYTHKNIGISWQDYSQAIIKRFDKRKYAIKECSGEESRTPILSVWTPGMDASSSSTSNENEAGSSYKVGLHMFTHQENEATVDVPVGYTQPHEGDCSKEDETIYKGLHVYNGQSKEIYYYVESIQINDCEDTDIAESTSSYQSNMNDYKDGCILVNDIHLDPNSDYNFSRSSESPEKATTQSIPQDVASIFIEDDYVQPWSYGNEFQTSNEIQSYPIHMQNNGHTCDLIGNKDYSVNSSEYSRYLSIENFVNGYKLCDMVMPWEGNDTFTTSGKVLVPSGAQRDSTEICVATFKEVEHSCSHEVALVPISSTGDNVEIHDVIWKIQYTEKSSFGKCCDQGYKEEPFIAHEYIKPKTIEYQTIEGQGNKSSPAIIPIFGDSFHSNVYLIVISSQQKTWVHDQSFSSNIEEIMTLYEYEGSTGEYIEKQLLEKGLKPNEITWGDDSSLKMKLLKEICKQYLTFGGLKQFSGTINIGQRIVPIIVYLLHERGSQMNLLRPSSNKGRNLPEFVTFRTQGCKEKQMSCVCSISNSWFSSSSSLIESKSYEKTFTS